MAEEVHPAPAPAPAPSAAAAKPPDQRPDWLWATVVVAGVLCLLAAGVMLVRNVGATADNPLLSPQAAVLRAQLAAEPRNEQLKQQIRELDLRLRRRYFQHLALIENGTWLLASGALVLFAAAFGAVKLNERRLRPGRKVDAATAARGSRLAHWAVVGTGFVAGAGLLTLAVTSPRSPLPNTPDELDKVLQRLAGGAGDEQAGALPSLAEWRANWPRFLGADGNALATNFSLPAVIDFASGTGIAWKTPVPAAGFNSPLVWGNRVYFSGGGATNLAVFAFDAATGALVWQRAVTNVPGSPTKPPEIAESTGYAAPTMATDGLRVYAIFANGDLAAFTLEGAPVWSQNLGVPHNQYGFATSLAVWQGKVIVQYDQGDAAQGLSKLLAIDGATGRVVWQKARAVPESWASPIVIEAAGKAQIITLAGQWIIAYSAADGAELWRVDGLNGEITPSPIFAGGFVLITSPSDKLLAIRPDGTGDVTKSHVVWKAEDGIPDITSPVSDGELVFLVTTAGLLTCYEVATGTKIWEHEIEFDVHATPAVAGGKLIIFGVKGNGLVAQAGREYKEIVRFEPGEGVVASPAFGGGHMYVRGLKTLFCVGSAPGSPAETLEVKR